MSPFVVAGEGFLRNGTLVDVDRSSGLFRWCWFGFFLGLECAFGGRFGIDKVVWFGMEVWLMGFFR